MIIETSANRLYRILTQDDAYLAQAGITHCWMGVEVKRVRGQFIDKKNAHPELVRKVASRTVEA